MTDRLPPPPRCSPRLWIPVVGLVLLSHAWTGHGEPIGQARQKFCENDWEEAIGLLQNFKAPTKREQAETFFTLGLFHLHDQRLSQAELCFENALTLDTTNSEYHRALAETYGARILHAGLLAKTTMARKMKSRLEQALRLNPGNLKARFLLLQYYLHAPAIAGGGTSAAQHECRLIEVSDPHLAMRGRLRIVAQESRKDLARTLESASPGLREDPEMLNELSGIYADGKEFLQAFALLDKLLRTHPGCLRAKYQLGRTVALSGQRLQDGIQALDDYLRCRISLEDPPMVWAHYRLGMIHAQAGNKEAARTHYELALQRSPGHPEIVKAAQALAAARQ